MSITNLLISCICLVVLIISSAAQVPINKTFKYYNNGDFGPYVTEYGASYRTLPISCAPFQLCFYNTTPSSYYLGLGMGIGRSKSILRWVWEANRGHPVGENATLTFSRSGNLVLAHADGRVAWQTNTAYQGVVGLQLESYGNLVLLTDSGKYFWESFHFPTDTLLVPQSLILHYPGRTKLVSRASPEKASNGRYSLELEERGIAMYMVVHGNRRIAYYNYSDGIWGVAGPMTSATFGAEPVTDEGYAYNLMLNVVEGGAPTVGLFVGQTKYNGTFSFARIDVDGNFRVYTYNDKVESRAWEVAFAFFSDEKGLLSGCRLPTKCGALGVCENEMCVACPSSKGLLGWSSACAPPRPRRPCDGVADYFKVEGIEHFLSPYEQGIGPLSVGQCKDQCSKDCACLAIFYRQESSKCLIVNVLGTLAKTSNSSHIAYIKNFK